MRRLITLTRYNNKNGGQRLMLQILLVYDNVVPVRSYLAQYCFLSTWGWGWGVEGVNYNHFLFPAIPSGMGSSLTGTDGWTRTRRFDTETL